MVLRPDQADHAPDDLGRTVEHHDPWSAALRKRHELSHPRDVEKGQAAEVEMGIAYVCIESPQSTGEQEPVVSVDLPDQSQPGTIRVHPDSGLIATYVQFDHVRQCASRINERRLTAERESLYVTADRWRRFTTS